MLALLALLAFQPLFDGKTLDGWMHEGPRASFSAAGGELTTSGLGSYPNWIRTAGEYENFRLRFEYKLAQWAETAVLLRSPRWGRASQSGIAIMLAHDFHKQTSNHVTGAIAGVLAPKVTFPPSYEQWHSVQIELDGDQLRVTIDGTAVQDLAISSVEALRHRLRRGHIGFQDLGHRASFRNIQLENLGDRERYVYLFDGRNLEGWKLRGAGNWLVRDGSIFASNGHGVLYAPGGFGDFELTLAVRTHDRVNGGVFLRGQPDGPNRGLEIQVYSPPDAVYPTGSIYGLVRSDLHTDYEGQWIFMQVRVAGSSCTVWVEGQKVAETSNLPRQYAGPGQVGLQVHLDNASVEYRDLRVRVIEVRQ